MHNYLLIQVLGRRALFTRRSVVNIEVIFVRPSGQHVSMGKVMRTTMADTHDLEHLAAGVGFTSREEAITGALVTQYGLVTVERWHKATGFTKKDVKNFRKFLTNMFWTNKPETWKLSKVSGKLTFEKVN